MTAAGAYLKLEGGDIELGAPGTIEFKATKKDWTTPQAASGGVALPDAGFEGCVFKMQQAAQSGAAIV